MSKHIKIDGVSIDKGQVAAYKSEAAFVKAWSEDKTYAHLFTENKEAKLKEVWLLSQPKEAEVKKPGK